MRMLSVLAVCIALFSTPASAHEFLDYFEYGQTELSPAGYQMVRSVAAYAQSDRWGRPTRVLISAHMDTAEAAEFSDELSRRRAQSVASELVILGIDPAIIVMQSRGASAPARPTAPNRQEPLNRRVTVGVNF